MIRKLLIMLAAAAVGTACGRQPEPPPRQTAPAGSEAAPTPPAAGAPGAPGAPEGAAAGESGAATTADATPAAPGVTAPPPAAGAPTTPAQAAPPPSAAADAPARAPAQDEGAAALLRAAAAYENVRSLSADFVMNFENPLLRQTTVSRGTIQQRQPDRIAVRFSDPAGDLILSDGQYFWVYYPSVNPDQVMRSPAAAAGESGVNLQAQFVGNPVERFRYELHGTEQVAGRGATVLTLVPRQRAEYRSLKVWLDARDGLARRFEITEHNGSVRRFDLSNLQVNPAIPDATFRFTPPPGARIINTG
jgi:outer membrane lipoprotein-sorting protein